MASTKTVVSAWLDVESIEKLDDHCRNVQQSRSAVLRGLLYALFGGGPVPPVLMSRFDRDGREAEALQFIQDNPDMSLRKLQAGLQGLGIKRKKTWISDKRYELLGRAQKQAQEAKIRRTKDVSAP